MPYSQWEASHITRLDLTLLPEQILFGGILLWTVGIGCLYCGVWDVAHLTFWWCQMRLAPEVVERITHPFGFP